MTNRFEPESHPDVLVNISTGLHASQEVPKSLLKLADVGKKHGDVCDRSADL